MRCSSNLFAHTSSVPSDLMLSWLPDVLDTAAKGPVLDLASGAGRNGLVVLAEGANVVFADRDGAALEEVRRRITKLDDPTADDRVEYWTVDFEIPGQNPLAGKRFGAIVVFRYLHRPLMKAIREAIAPGGLIVYETFTQDQPHFGRPTNPDFLLRHGELSDEFAAWEVLHSRECLLQGTGGGNPQAVAQLVARRPA